MATATFTPGDVVNYHGSLTDDHGLWVFAGPSDRTPPGWPEERYRLVRPDDRLESVGAASISEVSAADAPRALAALGLEIRVAFEGEDC